MSEVEELSGAIQKIRTIINGLIEKHDKLSHAVPKLEVRLEQLKKDVKAANDELVDALKEQEEIKDDISSRKKQFVADVTTKNQEIEAEKKILAQDRNSFQMAKSETSTALKSQEKELDKRDIALAKKEGEVRKKEQNLSLRESELNAREKGLDKREKELDIDTSTLDTRGREIEDTRSELDHREHRIAARESELDEREMAVKKKETQINSDMQKIKDERKEIEAERAFIVNERSQLARLEKDLKDRDARLRDREATADVHRGL